MSEPTPQSQGPDPDAQTPPPARKRARTPGAWRAWLPSGAQVLTMFIGLLISSNLMLWLEVTRLKEGPAVAVVGVKDMTKAYIERIGSANLSPTEAAARATLFVAVAQDEMKHLVPGKRQLVLAKECVLAGQTSDITPFLAKTVDAKLATLTSGLSNIAGPVSGVGAALASGQLLGAAPASPGDPDSGASQLDASGQGHITAAQIKAFMAGASPPAGERRP